MGDIAPPGGDGFVNVTDLLKVINEWNADGSSVADINNDNIVNVSDVLLVIKHWGSCP